MVTKKEERIARRKGKLIELALKNQVYCIHHRCFLDPEDIENHSCYSGNHGSRYCNYVDFPGGNREGRRARGSKEEYDEPDDR